MSPIFVILIILFIGGILFLTNPFTESKETREQYLERMRAFLEGKTEPVDGKENSYRIFFQYYDRQFVYEDAMEVGFKKEVNNAYLKTKTNKNLELSFNPITKGGIIHTETLIVSSLKSRNYQEKIEIKLPEELKVFKISTNDPIQAKALIEDPKVAQVFAYYKDSDVQGQHRMSLTIKKGVVLVTFHPSVMRHPSIFSLHSNIHHIEEHLEKVSVLGQAVDKLPT